MTDLAQRLSSSHDIAAKTARLLQTRIKLAQERFNQRVKAAYDDHLTPLLSKPQSPWDLWAGLLADKRVQRIDPAPEQLAMLARVRADRDSAASRRPRVVASR
jgi:hypothetical protein